MTVLSLALALLCTIFMCMGIILIKWIIAQVGATIFTMFLLLMSAIFLLLMGDKNNEA